MAKDFIKPITRLVANGENEKIAAAVNKSLAEIQEEIAALRQQEALLKGLVAFYAPSHRVEAPPKKVPTVPASITDDGLIAQDRSRMVRETALKLAQGGTTVLSAGDVIEALANMGVVFSIKRPASMAGTVLAGMREFNHVEQNRFAFVGSSE